MNVISIFLLTFKSPEFVLRISDIFLGKINSMP